MVRTPSTVMPIERAEPAMVRTAASRSAAVRSFCLVLAISSICARVSLPTLSVCGLGDPFSSLSAFLISTLAGGVFRTKVNDLSANAVITTGSISPGSTPWVCALNALQNSMMLRPRWPSAGPIGGDGLALPAGICSLMKPTIFFAMMLFRVRPRPRLAQYRPGECKRPRSGYPGSSCRRLVAGCNGQRPRALGAAPRCRGRIRGGRQPPRQIFSTCAKSSSTGVARPKIVTETRTFDLS